jgi:lactoylglutathione lyase
MLPVSDLDRSVAFYTNLLGMQVVRERKKSGVHELNICYVGYGDEGHHPAHSQAVYGQDVTGVTGVAAKEGKEA